MWCIIWILFPAPRERERERERGSSGWSFRARSSSHFGQHITNDSPSLVLGHIRELGPGEGVVEIVLHLVVLWQTEQVAVLHVQQVLRLHRVCV